MIALCDFSRQSRRVLFGILVGLLLSAGGLLPESLQAQPTGGNPIQSLQKQFKADSTLPSSSAELVSVETRLARAPVPAGESVRAAVVLNVKEGWHVNAHEPTLDYLIGTTIEWASRPGLMVNQTQYPEPTRLSLDFAGEELDVYEGQSPIFLTVRPARSTEPGERRLTGRLRVQACNDQTCLRPATITTTLSVPVAETSTRPTPTGEPIFEKETTGSVRGTALSILRRHVPLAAGGILALGTVLFLVVHRLLSRRSDQK